MADSQSVVLDDIEWRMLIDGKLVPSSDEKRFPSINPYTEQVIEEAADGTEDDFRLAAAAARRAFDHTTWSTDLDFRLRCLRQLADVVEQNIDEIRTLLVAEIGSPRWLTRDTILDVAVQNIREIADLAEAYPWEKVLADRDFRGVVSKRLVWREPFGVVLGLCSYNAPWPQLLGDIAHAAAAGCTIVLKPSELTPLAGTYLGKIILEGTDFPPGTVNIVTSSIGPRAEVLTRSADVDFVTFVGSVPNGRRVAEAASGTIKQVYLELGGKSPWIVLPGVDAAEQAAEAGKTICTNAGQGCVARSRLLVPRESYEEAVRAAKAAMEAVTYGDPSDLNNFMGPVVSKFHQERILARIQRAVDEGARLVTGGGIPQDQEHGYFVEPTLLADVAPGSDIEQEEVFGPVLAIIPYDTVEEALEIANGTVYGLSATVVATTEEEALAFARKVRSGTIGINGGVWSGPDAPFGGYKQSGTGRKGGVRGFENFLETKVVGIPTSKAPESLAWGEV
ncbi:aldehyde dehydrogenase family protein [Arthrobacter sp. NPDC080031]|uniref:aldehyde dehydrogenase family protein n=1 Tax=Arthrobacter sp. NPDC080031 TaxID=3155918 RepID=UPI0034501D2F